MHSNWKTEKCELSVKNITYKIDIWPLIKQLKELKQTHKKDMHVQTIHGIFESQAHVR